MNSDSQNSLMSTYGRLDVVFSRGEGVWLWDDSGRRYFDALCGIAVCGLGHAHPAVTEALCLQAGELLHTSNLYRIAHQEALAAILTGLSGLDKAFFCNSGAEANETAIKMARRFGHQRDVEVPEIVVMDGSFHGRTLATLSATGNPKVHAGFEPLVEGFQRVPYGDADAVAAVFDTRPNCVAVLVEPVLGEGGIVIPPDGYLQRLREITDKHDALLMLDEIQTGLCRTGRWFAFQHEDMIPDVMTLAKSLGNGVPIGACIAGGRAAEILQPGNHGSTFGGNPLASRAALAVLDVMETEDICERAAVLAEILTAGFTSRLATLDGVVEIRNKGLMIGIELETPCGSLVKQALDAGVLINVTADTVVRLLPPLVMSDEEAEQLLDLVCPLITRFCAATH